jgi:hypothetical protein
VADLITAGTEELTVKPRIMAIESKFRESYADHAGLRPAYLAHPQIWEGLHNLHRLAEQIVPNDTIFEYLHAAQLLKHILALKNRYGKDGFQYSISGMKFRHGKAFSIGRRSSVFRKSLS